MYVCVYVSEHDSVKTVNSMVFKFGMYITGHRRTNPIGFAEYRMKIFLQEYKKEFLYITVHGVKFSKVFQYPIGTSDSAQIFYVYYRSPSTYCVDFGKFNINSFFTGVQKIILIHYSLWGQIIRSMLAYIQRFRLSSHLICALQITVLRIILILV